jgi:hypothetical protein
LAAALSDRFTTEVAVGMASDIRAPFASGPDRDGL